jgi:stage II sporulation protein D (peptidoglycan lytic transglycosylase)
VREVRGFRSVLWSVVLGAVLLGACAQPQIRVPTAPTVVPTIRVSEAGVVRRVPLEEYVAATILSEFDPPAGDEQIVEKMFEVQAIVSRTYALAGRGRHAREGFDLCSTSHCQLYEPSRLRSSRWASAARRAAEKTAGVILTYDGQPARALFHADCGGHTSSAASVWGGTAVPYLTSEADGARSHSHTDWTFDARMSAVRDALNGDSRTAIGGTFDGIQIAQRDAAGRAERVTLKGTRTVTVRGEVVRDVLTRSFGVKSLRSTLFHVARHGDRLVFTGRGFGHGVGLCQTGAFARLEAGASPAALLAHYFPGTVPGPMPRPDFRVPGQ